MAAVMLLVSAVMVVAGHRLGGLLLQVGMVLAGPLLSFVLLLRIAFNAGMMGAFAALNESERQSLHLSMAMAAIPCCWLAISAALLVLAAGWTSLSLATVLSHLRHCAKTSGLE